MTRKDLEVLAVLIVDEQERRFGPRALPLRSQGDQCDITKKDQYASIKTEEAESGEYKSPAQTARELLRPAPRAGSRKK